MTPDPPPADARDLARRVLAVLDMQRQYFAASGPRQLELLPACKAAERELRKLCEALVSPPRPEPPGLFDAAPDTVD